MIIVQITDLHILPKGKPAHGRVDGAAMLRAAVRRPDAPCPFRTGLPHCDGVSLAQPDALEAIVRRHDRLGLPGAAHQVTPDLRSRTEESLSLDRPGLQLHRRNGERLFTHTAVVGLYDGPCPLCRTR